MFFLLYHLNRYSFLSVSFSTFFISSQDTFSAYLTNFVMLQSLSLKKGSPKCCSTNFGKRIDSKENKTKQKKLTPWGNNDLNFRLARDQVMYPETAQNYCSSRRQANGLIFLARHSVLLSASPLGTQRVEGSQNSPLPFGPVIECFT